MKPILVWHANCYICHHEESLAARKLMVGKIMINVEDILIPISWDKKGNMMSVAIATDDESEYLPEDQAVAKKLKPLLRHVVHVGGVVKTEHGKKHYQD